MPNALNTGSSACASDVVAALRGSGFEPLSADRAVNLVQVCASVAPKSLDCYIQFPDDHVVRTTAVAGAPAMIGDRGMARHEAVTAVAPLLAEGATVVLVMGERATDRDGHSPPEPASVPAGGGEDPAPDVASYIDIEPALGFAEWRLEVLSLLGVDQ